MIKTLKTFYSFVFKKKLIFIGFILLIIISNILFSLNPYFISASPIHVSDQIWKVVTVTSERSLLAFNYKMYNIRVVLLFIVTAFFIGVTLRISRNAGYKNAVKDEHKLHNIS